MSRSTRSPCDWGSLERQLQSKLNLSRCRHRAQNSAGARVHHACGQQSSPVCLVGYPEVGMVEDVEHLGAEVQRLGLPQCELLEEREIAAHELGPISVFLPRLPIVPAGSSTNALASYQRLGSPRIGLLDAPGRTFGLS